jgi:UDP-N-acetylglucosamine acyltransferase
MPIHPTALVDPRAEIDVDVDLGPYVVIDGPVQIGRGTRIMAHAVLTGHTRLGCDNVVHYGAVLGDEPQDTSYKGAETYVHIGDRNVFREQVYVHRGAAPGSATVIGNDNYLMGQAHVAHNCRLADGVILASGAVLGGHVQVADGVFVSGNCVVHQHVRIGTLALLRGLSRTSRDVPPFCIMDWTHVVRGINRVGLQRAGFSSERIRAVRRAFAQLFGRRRHLRQALAEVEAQEPGEDVRHMLDFIHSSTRGICFGPRDGGGEGD